MKKHPYVFSVILFISLCTVSLLSTYVITDSSMDIKMQYKLPFVADVYYDMWNHLVNLDVSVDRNVIQNEAILSDGKTFAYFLPFPAVIRGILTSLDFGKYSAVSILLAVIVFAAFSGLMFLKLTALLGIQDQESNYLIGAILFAIVACSPILAMLSSGSVYWEAIIWGDSMYMVCLYLSLLVIINRNNLLMLVMFSTVCGLTLFTRPTFLFGAITLFVLTIFQLLPLSKLKIHHQITIRKFKWGQLMMAIAVFSSFLALLGVLNFERWGSAVELVPLEKHIQYMGNRRGEDYKVYGAFQLDRLPESFSYFFLPTRDNFIDSSPFIKPSMTQRFVGFAKHFDYREQSLPLIVVWPVAFVLCVVGARSFIALTWGKTTDRLSARVPRYFFPLAFSALIPGLILLPLPALAMRYRGDFLPGIVFFSILSISIFLKNRANKNKFRRNDKSVREPIAIAITILFVLSLSIFSAYFSISSALAEKGVWFGEKCSHIAAKFPSLFNAIEKCPLTVSTASSEN